MRENDLRWLKEAARQCRIALLRSIHHSQTGHAGSSLSLIEILVFLYTRVMRHRPVEPEWAGRDRLVLSKGHGAPALYTVLSSQGYFPVAQLQTLRHFGSGLHGHPKAGALPGIDVCTGSLGQGLSIAAGICLGHRLAGVSNRVFCILGDGELNEGQNWEAMMAASTWRLGNLVAIVDRNGLQNDGPTESIIHLEDLCAKARAFNWDTVRIDGHDFEQLDAALGDLATSRERPLFVVADTVKGKGVSYMQGVVKWHHHPISDAELEQALMELEGQE